MQCSACAREVLWTHDVNRNAHQLADEPTCGCNPAPACPECDAQVLRDSILCAAGIATLHALRMKHAPEQRLLN